MSEHQPLSTGWKVVLRVAQIVTVVAVLALWSIRSRGGSFLGSPSAVASELRDWLGGDRRDDIWASVSTMLVGAALGVAVGIALVAIVSANRTVDNIISPWLAVANAIPRLALVPIFIILFGIDMTARVYFVATVVFFIPFYGLRTAVAEVDPNWLSGLRALGGGRRSILRHVYVPALTSALVACLRLTIAWALIATVLSEIIVSTKGIGHTIRQFQQQLNNSGVLGAIACTSVIAFAADRLVVWAERRLLAWKST